MGFFDFFKRQDKTEPKKPPVEPNGRGEFNLQLSDFSLKIHKSVILEDVKIDTEFNKEFAHLLVGKPAKAGDAIELKSYYLNIVLWGQSAEVMFDSGIAHDSLQDFILKINQQLNWLVKSKNLVEEVIIRDLLQLKNDNWLEENQSQLNKDEFLRSIQLTSINFSQHAEFNMLFDAGDLFEKHSINVKVGSKKEVEKATIVG